MPFWLPVLANPLDLMSKHPLQCQQGHTLVQSLVGMLLSSWVITASFAAFAWVHHNHLHLQALFDLHERMHTALLLVQDRVARAGAPAVQFDAQSKASLLKPASTLQGSDTTLSLTHHISLTPSDCQGHQASSLQWIQDDFKRSTRNELSCKDSLRSNTSYQALVDNITQVGLLYAQALSGPVPQLQWRKASQVSDWQSVRGVQVCLQTQLGVTSLPAPTLACSSNLLLSPPALAWRGVVFVQHTGP